MYKLLLADDDNDDCLFFQDALGELVINTILTTVNDGVQLMDYLKSEKNILPDVLFLDLNMPRKSGFECLSEIKKNQNLKELPVVIISTSMDIDVVNQLHINGAHYYIRKPGDFKSLKKAIEVATSLLSKNSILQPTRSDFILQP